MTEKELEKLIENQYGPYPDDRPGVAPVSAFPDTKNWNKYCQETIKLLNKNLSKKDFLNYFPVLSLRCGALLPPDE